MKKLFYCIVVLISLTFNSCNTREYVVTAEHGINVRATPSKKGNVVGKLKYHDEVNVVSIDGDWAKIEYKKKEAYVHTDYISSKFKRILFQILIGLIVGTIFLGMSILAFFSNAASARLKNDGTVDKRYKHAAKRELLEQLMK